MVGHESNEEQPIMEESGILVGDGTGCLSSPLSSL